MGGDLHCRRTRHVGEMLLLVVGRSGMLEDRDVVAGGRNAAQAGEEAASRQPLFHSIGWTKSELFRKRV